MCLDSCYGVPSSVGACCEAVPIAEAKVVPLLCPPRMEAWSRQAVPPSVPVTIIIRQRKFTMKTGKFRWRTGRRWRASRALTFACLLILWAANWAQAADFSADEVRAALTAATPERNADFSGKSLEGLDLSDLDLRRANLAGANLYGAKLVGADLTGVDLSGAILNLAWIMRANFTGANLSKASLQGLVVSSGLEINLAEAPSFKGANFTGARIIARFSRFDLSGADFSHAMLGADMKNQSMGLMRTDFAGANLAGANFAGADLGRASLRFANLTGANLTGARLTDADLSGADLTGADLSNADADGADFGNAILKDAKGLDTVRGLDLTRPGG
jgi:uncharacterized protein YjbI with pentapeptide repeats